MDDPTLKSIPSSSAVFNSIPEMMFRANDLSFKIEKIYPDSGERNLEIQNIDQLKQFLFERIRIAHNSRTHGHDMTLPLLGDSELNNLQIINFKFIKNEGDDIGLERSGQYRIYPRGLRCSKCHDFVILNKDTQQKIFRMKCQHQTCSGIYRNISMLKYCEKCGKLDEIYWECPEHPKAAIKLNWADSEAPITWRFVCTECHKEHDFLMIPCNHQNFGEKLLKSGASTKYKPLSIRSGGVVTPVAVTTVDIPKTKTLDHPQREQLILAAITGRLNYIPDNELDGRSILEYLDEMFSLYRSSANKHLFMRKNPEATEKDYADYHRITETDEAIEYVAHNLPVGDINTEEIINYHALKGTFSPGQDSVKLSSKKPDLLKNLKDNFSVNEITYLPKLKLISSCIGTIHGPTHSDDPDFVPHFFPNRDKKFNDRLLAYSYPYETEGILIEFSKELLLSWLKSCTGTEYAGDPSDVLLKLKAGSEEHNKIFTLLHTISHLLIKKSALYTGIDTDSCGEMVFPTSGAILIYSTSAINIGGFGSVFENKVSELFIEADFELKNCVYDPLCLREGGACFSCIFLPEFVCCNFNKQLDRDIIRGSAVRYKTRLW